MSEITPQDITEIIDEQLPIHRPEWKEMGECYDYVMGRQYTQEELNYLDMWKRADRTYNIIFPQIVTVDGYQIQNRGRLECIPREAGDAELAEVRTEVLNWQLHKTGFSTEMKYAIRDAMIARRGQIMMYWVLNDMYPDGNVVVERLSPFNVMHDFATSSTKTDGGRWKIYTIWLPPDAIAGTYFPDDISKQNEMWATLNRKYGDEFERRFRKGDYAKYGESNDSLDLGNWGKARGGKREHDAWSGDPFVSNDYIDTNTGMCRVVSFHYREYKNRKAVITQDGRPFEIPRHLTDDKEFIREIQELLGSDQVHVWSEPVYHEAVAVPAIWEEECIQRDEYEVQTGRFNIWTLECFDYDPDTKKRMSYVDLLRSPQDKVNRDYSTFEDIIMRALNPDYLRHEQSIPNDKKHQQTWYSQAPARNLIWKGNIPPQRLDMDNIGSIVGRDIDQNLDIAPRITNITSNLQGQSESSKESGKLFDMRRQQAENALQSLVDNVVEVSVSIGKSVDKNIQERIWTQRVIRLVRPGGQKAYDMRVNEYDPVVDRWKNELDAADMDVQMDMTKMSRIEREAKFEQKTQMLQYMPEALRIFAMKGWFKLSGFGDTEELIRAWRVSIITQFGPQMGPMILEAIESDDGFDSLMQFAKGAAGGGGAGVPDPFNIQRSQLQLAGPENAQMSPPVATQMPAQ